MRDGVADGGLFVVFADGMVGRGGSEAACSGDLTADVRGGRGVGASVRQRAPFVLEISDLWPESVAAVGAMKSKNR